MGTKKRDIVEFINSDGSLINSKVPPQSQLNPNIVTKSTTDQHVNMARQGMVWMNYRRYYGEDSEKLPYESVADKYAKDPKKFYYFLKKLQKTNDFEKYFTEKKEKKTLEEIAKGKMKQLIEKIKVDEVIFDPATNYLPDIEELREHDPLLINNLDDVIEGIIANLTEKEQITILNYMRKRLKDG